MSLFALLAFLIPFPLFYDLSSWSFVVHPVEYNIILLEAGIPVPLGLGALALIILCSLPRLPRTRIDRATAIALYGLAVFCCIECFRITPVRLFSLAVPVLLILGIASSASRPVIAEKISRGYLAGFLTQALLHACSILFYSPGRETFVASSRTFFGYEIYQGMLSYSAIFSAAGAAVVIFALAPRTVSSRLRVLSLALPVYLIVISATRKAALADMGFLFMINAFLLLCSVRFPKIYLIRKDARTNAFIFAVLTSALGLFVVFSPREISLGFALEQRSSNYEFFLAALPGLNLKQVLTGYAPGWGGYSNLFVELFVRSGLIGMAGYLLAMAVAFKRFYRELFVPVGEFSSSLRNDVYVKSWFAFVAVSFLLGNLVNVNFHLPYYMTNFLMLNVCFIHFYSRYRGEALRNQDEARR